MMRMRALALAIGCATISGCALFRGAPEARAVAVDLPVSRAEMVRRTLTAFREQGYPIKSTLTSGLNPESEPFRQGDAEAVFRAAITGSERSAHVVLTGTYRRVKLGGVIRGKEEEVKQSDDPVERALWNRLEQLRLAIQQRGT